MKENWRDRSIAVSEFASEHNVPTDSAWRIDRFKPPQGALFDLGYTGYPNP